MIDSVTFSSPQIPSIQLYIQD